MVAFVLNPSQSGHDPFCYGLKRCRVIDRWGHENQSSGPFRTQHEAHRIVSVSSLHHRCCLSVVLLEGRVRGESTGGRSQRHNLIQSKSCSLSSGVRRIQEALFGPGGVDASRFRNLALILRSGAACVVYHDVRKERRVDDPGAVCIGRDLFHVSSAADPMLRWAVRYCTDREIEARPVRFLDEGRPSVSSFVALSARTTPWKLSALESACSGD